MDTNRLLIIAAAVVLALIIVWYLLTGSTPTGAHGNHATCYSASAAAIAAARVSSCYIISNGLDLLATADAERGQ